MAQPGQLDFRHYTVDDGLPSSEVYTTFQDKEGFIWIGTDNGVARFDGYEFVVYDKDDGLDDMVVFTFHEDVNGRLWASTYSGMVFYFDNGRFYPYVYNDITTELKKTSFIVKLVDITKENNMIFLLESKGIVSINPNGELRSLTEVLLCGDTLYVYQQEVSDKLKIKGGGHIHHTASDLSASELGVKMFVLKGDSSSSLIPFRMEPDIKNTIPRYAGVLNRSGQVEVVISNREQIAIKVLKEGTSYQHQTSNGEALNYVMPGKNKKEYWMFFDRGLGVKRYDFSQSNTEPHVTTFLGGHSVSSGAFDQSGGFWITTLDDGIYYSSHPEQQLYSKADKELNGKSISIVLTGPSNFYVGYDDSSIFSYCKGEERLLYIQKPE